MIIKPQVFGERMCELSNCISNKIKTVTNHRVYKLNIDFSFFLLRFTIIRFEQTTQFAINCVHESIFEIVNEVILFKLGGDI